MAYSKKSNPMYRNIINKAIFMAFNDEIFIPCLDAADRDRVIYYLSSERKLLEETNGILIRNKWPIFSKGIKHGNFCVIVALKRILRPIVIENKHDISLLDIQNMRSDGFSDEKIEKILDRSLTEEEKNG